MESRTTRNSELDSISTQPPPSPAPPSPGVHSTHQVQHSLFQPGDFSKQPASFSTSLTRFPHTPALFPNLHWRLHWSLTLSAYTVQFRQAQSPLLPTQALGAHCHPPPGLLPSSCSRPTSHSFPGLPFPELDTHCLMSLVTLCLVHLPHSLPPPASPDSLLHILGLNFSSQYHLLQEVSLVSKVARGLPCAPFTIQPVTSLNMTGKREVVGLSLKWSLQRHTSCII